MLRSLKEFSVIERLAFFLIDSLGIRSALGIFSPDDGHAHLWYLPSMSSDTQESRY